MRSAGVAEWMLARWMSKDRAMGVVGDLEETAVGRGRVWFWRSVMGVLVATAWRPVAGYVAAVVGVGALRVLVSYHFVARAKVHPPTTAQVVWGAMPVPITLLWFVALYGLIRFGWKDVVTRLAAGYALLGGIMVYFCWQPAVQWVGLGVAAVLLAASMFDGRTRRGTGVVWMIVGILTVLWTGEMLLVAVSMSRWHLGMVPFEWMYAGTYLAMVWIICVMSTRVHGKMLASGKELGKMSV